ncbi:hypothetical protein [Gottfriedia acidiceleris]|uniref:hypothetical protein n=1 Tax=Gottfriedia acidiceleris TaxID=371036 RepID=UPI003D208B66
MFEKIIFNKNTLFFGLLGTFFIVMGTFNLYVSLYDYIYHTTSEEINRLTESPLQLKQIPIIIALMYPILILQFKILRISKINWIRVIIVGYIIPTLVIWVAVYFVLPFIQGYFKITAFAQMIPFIFALREVFIKVFPKFIPEKCLNIGSFILYLIIFISFFTGTSSEVKYIADAVNDGITQLSFGLFILVLVSDNIKKSTFGEVISFTLSTNNIFSIIKFDYNLKEIDEEDIIKNQLCDMVIGLGYLSSNIKNFKYFKRPDSNYEVSCAIDLSN